MILRDEEQARAYVADFVDAAGMERLDRLEALLREENERQNLIAAATLQTVWLRHVADSAQLLSYVPRETEDPGAWLDLGTGAGFPGLVIAAMRPHWDVRLIESRRKRTDWLERARIDLGLGRCQVVASRLEMVATVEAGVISARAFAPMPKLIDLSARFSTNRTLWLLPKGRSAAQDLASLPESTRRLFHVEQSCTDTEAGIIVGRLDLAGHRGPKQTPGSKRG
ncbi:16S rRNA (guanine(527)-N(7))-methyltransferase RsmG [Erythrobacter sp. SG61-1L]|uniref:16S rRNA (guanine(527)-N(7))-methyltransferase RsmG n=1 Tax=Erythrobacter sp. SG61-1L TaxID=1603897 RepID=UPI0006C91E94|nr:16S rRNA (guanine(527)-N(7))-methyltransferase RsmG [Erythrobacter sp. SG61-1L]